MEKVNVPVNAGDRERWRQAAEADPILRHMPNGRRLSSFVRRAVEVYIESMPGIEKTAEQR